MTVDHGVQVEGGTIHIDSLAKAAVVVHGYFSDFYKRIPKNSEEKYYDLKGMPKRSELVELLTQEAAKHSGCPVKYGDIDWEADRTRKFLLAYSKAMEICNYLLKADDIDAECLAVGCNQKVAGQVRFEQISRFLGESPLGYLCRSHFQAKEPYGLGHNHFRLLQNGKFIGYMVIGYENSFLSGFVNMDIRTPSKV